MKPQGFFKLDPPYRVIRENPHKKGLNAKRRAFYSCLGVAAALLVIYYWPASEHRPIKAVYLCKFMTIDKPLKVETLSSGVKITTKDKVIYWRESYWIEYESTGEAAQ